MATATVYNEEGMKWVGKSGKKRYQFVSKSFLLTLSGEKWSPYDFLGVTCVAAFISLFKEPEIWGRFQPNCDRNSNFRATVVLPNGSITIKNNFLTKPIIIAPFVPQNRFNSGWQSINVTIWLAPAHLTDRSDRNTYDFLCQSFRNNRNLSPSSQQPRKSFHPIELIILACRLRYHRNIHAQLAVGTRTLIQCSSFALWLTITAVTATLCCWTHSFHAS